VNARKVIVIAVLAVGFVTQLCVAQEIAVAAAADLQFAMQDVAARFQKETGKGQTDLGFVWQLLPASSEWRPL
jgi:ABC-type molybdate transport system substrate-binding protein